MTGNSVADLEAEGIQRKTGHQHHQLGLEVKGFRTMRGNSADLEVKGLHLMTDKAVRLDTDRDTEGLPAAWTAAPCGPRTRFFRHGVLPG